MAAEVDLTVDANVEAVWLVLLPAAAGHPQFWVGVLRRQDGGGFVFEHRTHLQGQEDRLPALRAWNRIASATSLPRADALWHARGMALEISETYGFEVAEVLMNPQRDAAAFLEELRAQPWAAGLSSTRMY